MKIDKRMENHEFKMYWLSHASPDTVFEWLRNQEHHDSYQEEIDVGHLLRES